MVTNIDDDDDAFDANGVCRDGRGVHVSAMIMDSRRFTRLTDEQARAFQPGFRCSDADPGAKANAGHAKPIYGNCKPLGKTSRAVMLSGPPAAAMSNLPRKLLRSCGSPVRLPRAAGRPSRPTAAATLAVMPAIFTSEILRMLGVMPPRRTLVRRLEELRRRSGGTGQGRSRQGYEDRKTTGTLARPTDCGIAARCRGDAAQAKRRICGTLVQRLEGWQMRAPVTLPDGSAARLAELTLQRDSALDSAESCWQIEPFASGQRSADA